MTPSDGAGGPTLVSPGTGPKWRQDGGELFFWVGNRLTAIAVNARGTTPTMGAATPLFEHQHREDMGASYAVSGDGRRFLVNAPTEESTSITLLINWPALLNKRD